MPGFGGLDWAVVGGYFLIVFAVAFWSGSRKTEQASDYFLAGRSTGWFVLGASVFASNIGSEHLVGLAGSGAASGVAVAQFEILAAMALLLLGWLFAPFYVRSGVATMPEFLERRYSAGPRYYLAGISILAYVLTKISVTIAAGGIVFEALMGIDFWTGALITVAATGAYTLWGGLRAVLWTDMLQMFVLIAGAIAVTLIGLGAIGGWDGLVASVEPARLSLWRPMSHPDFPWTGILFGAPILAIWYWCTDQFIVQRVLSAKSIGEARRGVIFAGFMKQLPLFIFVLPGLIAFALAQQGKLELASNDAALPALVEALMPAGIKGLVAAGLLAALMSSLSSVFNSCATLITVDLYQKARPQASERSLVVVGRLSVAALTALGLAWIPFIDLVSGQLFTYIQSVQAYVSPPIAAVFLVGVLWPRANASGAMTALLVGFVLGIGRLALEINATAAPGALAPLAMMNFLHFAILLFGVSVVVLIVVSLATRAPDRAAIAGLTLGGRRSEADPGRGLDIGLSCGLVLAVLAIWTAFSSFGFGAAHG
jgi:SSS sodium solute transporter superfamily